MYGANFNDGEFLHKNEILLNYQFDLFKLALGYIPELNKRYISKSRDDRDAGCRYELHNGILWFIDFGDPNKTHKNAIDIMMEATNLEFSEVIMYINDIISGKIDDINITIQESIIINQQRDRKSGTNILYLPREWDLRDRQYWYINYGISRTELMADGVLPIVWYKWFSRKSNREIVVRPNDICYAYLVDDKVKIYRPHAHKDSKWIGNMGANNIGRCQSLISTNPNQILITKAYKDCRIIANLGVNTKWFTNEGVIPNDDLLVEELRSFKEVFIFFDNDFAGLTAAYNLYFAIERLIKEWRLSCSIKIIHYIPCLKLLKIKDASDQYNKEGELTLINFLQSHGVTINQSKLEEHGSTGDTKDNTPFMV